MDYSNREGMGSSDPINRPKHRQLWLALVLILVSIVLIGRVWNEWHGKNEAKQSASDYTAFVAAVHAADDIADPLQRCLHYPDLPGSHWDNETTSAYCRLHNRHTLQLSEIEALLNQGKAGEVDRAFQSYLDTQLHDPKQPGSLDAAFYSAGFDDAKADTRKIIDMWKQQSPDSAFALAASGEQYVDAAQQARGTGWVRDLGDNQVVGMHQQLVLARQDLDRAVKLLPSITPAYSSMVDAGALDGDDDYSYQAAKNGLAVDPANFALRLQMMNLAQPKWGGQFGGEDEQKREAEALSVRNPLLRMVAQDPAVYRVICDCSQAEINRRVALAIDKNLSSGNLIDMAAQVYNADQRLAVEIYSEALRFEPTHIDALRWRSQEMIALGERQEATATFAAVARRFPVNNAMATELGNVYAQAGDAKHAEATVLAVLQRDPDNYYAMGVLGDLYNHAGHQPQKAEALADTMIREHPEKANGYIVRSCNQMDHNLPGVYDTIHYFIDHFGDDPQWKTQTAEMREYLLKHPERIGA